METKRLVGIIYVVSLFGAVSFICAVGCRSNEVNYDSTVMDESRRTEENHR